MTKQYFPLFINSNNKKVLVIGAGKIAKRRIMTLAQFNFEITVVASDILLELIEFLREHPEITYINDNYDEKYITDQFIVLATTDNREVNQQIGIDAKAKNIFVSVCDAKEECEFLFPAIAVNDTIVAGITSEGKDHHDVRKTARNIREVLKNEN